MNMSQRTPEPKPHIIYHKDGSIYAKGQMLAGKMDGYWEFFRKDGTILRSGSFDDHEQQIGTWTTYGNDGKPLKITQIKPRGKPARKKKTTTTKKKAAARKRAATR
jgi:antitoxin component YwqK of YwqJK toxin-antitoxin module